MPRATRSVVWRNPRPLAGKEPSSAAKACGYLVRYEEDVVLAAKILQVLQIAGMVEPHAPCALDHRLQDDSSDLGLQGSYPCPCVVKAGRVVGCIEAAGGALHEIVP